MFQTNMSNCNIRRRQNQEDYHTNNLQQQICKLIVTFQDSSLSEILCRGEWRRVTALIRDLTSLIIRVKPSKQKCSLLLRRRQSPTSKLRLTICQSTLRNFCQHFNHHKHRCEDLTVCTSTYSPSLPPLPLTTSCYSFFSSFTKITSFFEPSKAQFNNTAFCVHKY